MFPKYIYKYEIFKLKSQVQHMKVYAVRVYSKIYSFVYLYL